MEEIQYVGETLWVGQIGNLAIVLGFVSALFASISYFTATQARGTSTYISWKNLGKIGYIIHSISIISLMGIIFYAMWNQMYEYKYVFEHVSDDLPLKYVLSAFWEGQEGSFMLWMFWHIILGLIILFNKNKFEAPVMMVIALVEVWINTMLLGIHIPWGDEFIKLGSNPVALIRQVTEAPIFANANYLELIEGRGLNPLLQNYWMTIHPPTTFLGFASTLIPFAFAIAGLTYKEDTEWLRAVQKWSLFSGGILGIGIFMGSLWAYEALSFGGYWAWDPVENTSLVPWIVIIAGIHTNLIALKTGYSIRFTYFAYLLGFILIVYSTLLTRSGILGDTSAHAFTEMGLEWQLTYFLLFIIAMALYHFFKRYKTIPANKKEESIYSREFWMFIGSLVLLFSAFLIDFSSSLPVFNTIAKVFDPEYVGKVIQDPIDHYNKYQLWIAILVALLSGIVIFFRYKELKWSPSKLKKLGIRYSAHILISTLITLLIANWIALPSWQFVILCWTSAFTISANMDYLIDQLRKSLGLSSAAFSHVGFGMLIIGVLASGLNSYYLNNKFVFKGVFADGDEEKYVQLFKEKPFLVRGHIVTYLSDTLIGKTRHYDLKFQKIDKDLNVIDSFITRPNAVYANDFSKIGAFNPDTKHELHLDIFTCIVDLPPSVRDMQEAKKLEDTLKFKSFNLALGDTLNLGQGTLTLESLSYKPTHPEINPADHDLALEIAFKIEENGGDFIHKGVVASGLTGNLLYKFPNKSEDFGVIVRPSDQVFDNILTAEDELDYESYNIKLGETIVFDNKIITLKGFDNNLDSARYNLQQGDISIGGLVNIKMEGKSHDLKPIYIIRGAAPMGFKDYSPETGLHVRLANIDPVEETFELKIAKNTSSSDIIPIEIATNVPRTDYIILQAMVFPGINLFWLGGILMMLGLLLAIFNKKVIQRNQTS